MTLEEIKKNDLSVNSPTRNSALKLTSHIRNHCSLIAMLFKEPLSLICCLYKYIYIYIYINIYIYIYKDTYIYIYESYNQFL